MYDQISIGGEAPKSFIRVYQFGRCTRSNKVNWIPYIAKVGHKWYPSESITEQLLTDLGDVMSFKLSSSKLVMASGQLRFLSEYFLPEKSRLKHGAEIFATYLSDMDIVENIENENQSRLFFTVKFVKEALKNVYPGQHEKIFNEFLYMLMFDAITGNNDRHYYNWGVVEHPQAKFDPFFSPIYDSARALLWNMSESNLALKFNDSTFIKRYCESSAPKIGIEGKSITNHFDLIEMICTIYPNQAVNLSEKIKNVNLPLLNTVLLEKYAKLLSHRRNVMIQKVLTYRINRLKNIFTYYGHSV